MLAEIKDNKLVLTTTSEVQEFSLPDPGNYPQGHILAIPWAGYFVRVRANTEWELAEIIPQATLSR